MARGGYNYGPASEEELMSTPGSIFNRPDDTKRRAKEAAETRKRIEGDLRELYAASDGTDPVRLAKARERAKNTLGYLDY